MQYNVLVYTSTFGRQTSTEVTGQWCHEGTGWKSTATCTFTWMITEHCKVCS